MKIFNIPIKSKKMILALGAESAGNFSVYNPPAPPLSRGQKIYFSDDFGDLLDDKNFKKFQKAVFDFLKKNKIKPDIILTDLHPLYKTTLWGAELAKKYKAKHIQIQHHIAHIFSVIGEEIINDTLYIMPSTFYGIALDGTGYGLDEKIWGGEIFQFSIINYQLSINRAGHLENQIMIGGDLAIKEPARMLISILNKFSILPARQCQALAGGNFKFSNKSQFSIFKTKKDFIYNFVKKHYTRNQFELLYNQLQNNFNCIETSSTGRILDAVSVLLGFCGNIRNYKHEPIDLLEKNSTKPYALKPVIENNILMTTPLFEYLIKNINKDKKRLAATAQLYIAQGLQEIINLQTKNKKPQTFIAGGISNNKIISSYLESKGAYKKNSVPRGDAGLSFGQILYHLSLGSRII